MHNDLSDIARGRRISAVTARDLHLIKRHDRPARHSPLRRALRRMLLRLAWWVG